MQGCGVAVPHDADKGGWDCSVDVGRHVGYLVPHSGPHIDRDLVCDDVLLSRLIRGSRCHVGMAGVFRARLGGSRRHQHKTGNATKPMGRLTQKQKHQEACRVVSNTKRWRCPCLPTTDAIVAHPRCNGRDTPGITAIMPTGRPRAECRLPSRHHYPPRPPPVSHCLSPSYAHRHVGWLQGPRFRLILISR